MSRPLVAVVAVARNGVIGLDGTMPWSVPSDLRHYRASTMGRPMIMGTRTLRSIGRLLDGRDSIVLTRSGKAPIEGAIVVGDPDSAVAAAERCADQRGSDEIVIAGGAEIYRLFWPRIDRIVQTLVEAEPEGDTWFPPCSDEEWRLLSDVARERGPKDSAATRLRVYERR